MSRTFIMVSTSSITVQSLGKIALRAGCRCENMVFVIFCLSQKPARCAFDWITIRRGIVSLFMGRFGFCFHIYFRRDCLFSCTRECPFPSPVEDSFPKIDGSVFAHHLNPTMEFGERCKLPQWGLGQSPSRS